MRISHEYIGQLRKGMKTNPSLDHLEALAGLLGVTVGWLATGEVPAQRTLTDAEQEQLDRVRAGLNELRVQNIAERLTGLEKEISIDAVEQMVEAMLEAERRMRSESDDV